MTQAGEMRHSTTSGTEKKLSSIYDGEYFEILNRQQDTLFVRCNTCGPDALQLRASAKSNGNILKHVKRRHPELLAKIREEKNIKTRGSCGPAKKEFNTSSASSVTPKKEMTFKTESIVFMESNHDSECMTGSYITTSVPDDKSPFAANVMVHLQPQPMHPALHNKSVTVEQQQQQDQQQHHVITSQQPNIINTNHHHLLTSGQHVVDEDPEEDDDQPDDDEDDDDQQECENIEYLTTNSHHDTNLLQIDATTANHQTQQVQAVSNAMQTRSVASGAGMRTRNAIIASSGDGEGEGVAAGGAGGGGRGSRAIIVGASSSSSAATKRRLIIPNDDDDDDIYEETDPLDPATDVLAGTSPPLFGSQASKYPSVNRTIDNDREVVALRKKLMLREFELVQQKHRLEIEILERELDFKKVHHQKTIDCLNKRLREK